MVQFDEMMLSSEHLTQRTQSGATVSSSSTASCGEVIKSATLDVKAGDDIFHQSFVENSEGAEPSQENDQK